MKSLGPVTWGRIFFLLALLLQLWRTDHYFTWSGSDRNQQLVGSLQILRGEYFSVPVASPGDLSQVESAILQGWPAGFRTLVMGLYHLTGDWFMSSRLFNAIGLLFLFLSVHLLLRALRAYLNPWLYPAFFAFWMFTFTPFHYTIGVEEWALACFVMACGALVKGSQQQETGSGNSFVSLGLILFFVGLGTWFRYLYFPLFLMGVSYVALNHLSQKAKARKSLLQLLLIGGWGLLVLWALKPSYTLGGHWWDTFLVETWYPEHLLKMDAFPLKAWAYFGIEGILNKWPALPDWVGQGLKIPFLVASLAVLWSLYRGFGKDQSLPWRQFQVAVLVAGLGTVGLLVFQSLARAPEWHNGTYHWTYVQETRYYAPLLLAIQVLGLARAFGSALPLWEKWAWRILLLGAFVYAGMHSTYRLWEGSNRETRWAETEVWLRESFATVREKSQAGEKVVWIYGETIYEEDEAHLAALAGASMIKEEKLPMGDLPTSLPLRLMTSVPALPSLRDAFAREGWAIIGESKERFRLSKQLLPGP
jgi:hypothetical protein